MWTSLPRVFFHVWQLTSRARAASEADALQGRGIPLPKRYAASSWLSQTPLGPARQPRGLCFPRRVLHICVESTYHLSQPLGDRGGGEPGTSGSRLRSLANREVPYEGWQLSRLSNCLRSIDCSRLRAVPGFCSSSKCREARRKGGFRDGRACRQFR